MILWQEGKKCHTCTAVSQIPHYLQLIVSPINTASSLRAVKLQATCTCFDSPVFTVNYVTSLCVFPLSWRVRLDLVLQNFARKRVTTKCAEVTSDLLVLNSDWLPLNGELIKLSITWQSVPWLARFLGGVTRQASNRQLAPNSYGWWHRNMSDVEFFSQEYTFGKGLQKI